MLRLKAYLLKKNEIIANLCPFMPENRRSFWHSLPECHDQSSDLLEINAELVQED